MKQFEFKTIGVKGFSRAGVLNTPHGKIKTPVFMPVGTKAAVKSLDSADLKRCGAQVILANTYHLYLRPGEKLIEKMGKIHNFMNWSGAILTDSGGYQVSSLGHFIKAKDKKNNFARSKIDDEGVTFFSHLDGSKHRLTAKKSIEIQMKLGADIIMAFDEATPNRGKSYARRAMGRTHRWLTECVRVWQKIEKKKTKQPAQALFGIVQGGNYRSLRRESAEFVASQNLPGIAIGGGSIGQDKGETAKNISWIREILPEDKPWYFMGVGVRPSDVISAVECGADMFDCVAPTRMARSGQLYSGKLVSGGKNGWRFESEFARETLNIANARFKRDDKLIDENCDCLTCASGYSRAYLHHLFKASELSYYRLASLHNVSLMIELTEKLREGIIKA